MNKWKQRAREWRKEANSYKGYYIDTDLTLKRERIQNDLLTERVNKELARVQRVCDALRAWQRGAREAWDFSTWLHANSTVLGLAILSEPKEEPC